MRYSPLENELGIFDGMSAEERLHYAATRMVESEEVWSLGDDNGWVIQEREGRQIITVWPYRQLALETAPAGAVSPLPQATSLEHFVYGILDRCQAEGIWLEVFPRRGEAGQRVPPARLYDLLTGLMESGEYVLEG